MLCRLLFLLKLILPNEAIYYVMLPASFLHLGCINLRISANLAYGGADGSEAFCADSDRETIRFDSISWRFKKWKVGEIPIEAGLVRSDNGYTERHFLFYFFIFDKCVYLNYGKYLPFNLQDWSRTHHNVESDGRECRLCDVKANLLT